MQYHIDVSDGLPINMDDFPRPSHANASGTQALIANMPLATAISARPTDRFPHCLRDTSRINMSRAGTKNNASNIARQTRDMSRTNTAPYDMQKIVLIATPVRCRARLPSRMRMPDHVSNLYWRLSAAAGTSR